MGIFNKRQYVLKRKRKKEAVRPSVLILSGVFILFLLGYLFIPIFTRTHELREEKYSLNLQIEKIHGQNADIRREIELLETDSFVIEKIAREELGLTRPGEIVYKVVSE